jgi:hypothetical protein
MSEVKRFKSHDLLAKWRLGIAVVAGMVGLQSSVVAETTLQTCGAPNIYGASLVRPENRLGEFLVELAPPAYGDRNSVRQHLTYSRLWSRILRSSLRMKTRDACDAILDAGFFPNLWAFLTIETPRDVSLDRARCIGALQDLLTETQQNLAFTRKAANDEMSAVRRWSESRGNFIVEADNILKNSMRSIFNVGSVMEALASVGAAEFQEIDYDGFESWLRKQRAFVKILRIDFSTCSGNSDSFSGIEGYRFPSSGVREPGVLSVKVGHQAKAPLLYSVVIVGLKTPPSSIPGATVVVQADVLDAYCNRERTFQDGYGDGKISVTVRCLRAVELTKPWVVLFCDPKDCETRQSADAVATAIAKDPDIVAFVKANTEGAQPIGPYLVNVEQSKE